MDPSKSKDVSILYIAGWGRSGSTLLDNILGQVGGFLSIGEMYWLWDQGLVDGVSCACGAQLRECEHWSPMLSEAFGEISPEWASSVAALRDRLCRTRCFPSAAFQPEKFFGSEEFSRFSGLLAEAYSSIQKVSASRLIIDSSKNPAYGLCLAHTPSLDVRVIHLVRDPRGVAHSWMRPKQYPDSVPAKLRVMNRLGPARSSAVWSSWNWLVERSWSQDPERYFRLRYEDFTEDPEGWIRRILDWLKQPSEPLPFLDRKTVQLEPNHTIAGNPIRFESGHTVIRRDDRWRSQMKARSQAIAWCLAWPLNRRYGYTHGR